MSGFENLKDIIPAGKLYDDLLSPSMKQIGQSLESVTKTAKFLLAPIEYAAAYRERWERYLQKVADNVKEENLIEGNPCIVVPTLEGMTLVEEDSILSEHFINLLSNSIDKTKQDLAHPAFPNLIKQLSKDEAVILFYLKKKPYSVKQQSDYFPDENMFRNKRTVYEEFPLHQLTFSDKIWFYMNHLNSLGLAGTWEFGEQEIIKDEITGIQTGVFINSRRKLTDFGELFTKSCTPDSFEGL